MANIITGSRILLSVFLLFVQALSPGFIVIYLLAGFTDMVDGIVARRTKTACEFGAKLDTIADICFVLVAAYKFLPLIRIPFWLWFWTGIIAIIKTMNIIIGFMLHKEFPAVHTIANKVVGLSLFLLPLSLPFVHPIYGAFLVCVMATFAAVQESNCIRQRK